MSDGTDAHSVNSGSVKMKLYETPQWRYNDEVLEGLLQHSHSSYNSVNAGHDGCPEQRANHREEQPANHTEEQPANHLEEPANHMEEQPANHMEEQPANHTEDSNTLLSVPVSDKHILSDYYLFHQQQNSIHSCFPPSNNFGYDLSRTRSPLSNIPRITVCVKSGIHSTEPIKTKSNSFTSATVTQPNKKKRKDKSEARSRTHSSNSTTTEKECPISSVYKRFHEDGVREPESRMIKSKGVNFQNLQRSITCFSAGSGCSHLLPTESSQRRSLEMEFGGGVHGAREPESRTIKSKGEKVHNPQSAGSGRSHLLPIESSQIRSLEMESVGEAHGAREPESRMIKSKGASFSADSGRSHHLPTETFQSSFVPASGQLVHTSDVHIRPESGPQFNVYSSACTDTNKCISSSLSEQLPTQQIPVVGSPTLGVMFEPRPEAQNTSGHLSRGQDSAYVPDRGRSEVSACTTKQVSQQAHGHTNMNGNTGVVAKLDHFMNIPSVKRLSSASECQSLPDVSSRFLDAHTQRVDRNFNPAVSLFSSRKGIKAIAALTRNLIPSEYWRNIYRNLPGGYQNQSNQYQKNMKPKKPSEKMQKNVEKKPSKLSVQLLSDVNSDGLLTCEICEEKFTSPAKLEEHLPVHMAVWKVKCSICDKRFTNQKHLSDHMASHGADTPFECDICHFTFGYADTLKKHKRRVHGEGKRKCKECHRNYEPGEYDKHAELHHSKDPAIRDKPHECDICFRRYKKPCALRDHKLSHSSEKTYMCSECGKTFKTKIARYFHSKVHSEKQKAEKKEKIPCKICKKEYFEHALYRHEKLHKLERTFMCEKCGKTFLLKHHLLNHEKSHTEEKPHVCSICDASFRLAHHLRAHRKTHQTTHKTKTVD